jgi:hypothetical protein
LGGEILLKYNITKANEEAFNRINSGQPVLKGIKYAKDVIAGLDKYTILHAGPPIEWDNMCGPLQGAIVGVLQYEGIAKTEKEAWMLANSGKIKFSPNHHHNAVGPMTGMISYSMPLFEIENESFGNKTYVTINEGLGKVMRFGANDEEVIERLKWMETEFAPIINKAIELSGGINLKVLMAKALTMGDEMHQRNVGASGLVVRELMPYIIRTTGDAKKLVRTVDFITANEQFFLNLAMGAGKAIMDPVKYIKDSTIVTTMCRNGTEFGIRVSGLGDEWFTAPVMMPKGLYFPGFSEKDANPDMGDSTIVETFGVGGFAMASAPAVVKFVGAGSINEAIAYTKDMYAITIGKSPHYQIPALNFQGVPTGIDIIKVVETGILPVINTGIAHKKPGVGQVGAGVVTPPMECFTKALLAFADEMGI